MNALFTKWFGASWLTTFWGGITLATAFVTQYPDMVSSILPAATAKLVFSIAAFISGAITFYNTKQKDVHGGTISTGTIPSVANTQQAVAVVQAKAIADGTPIPNTPVVPLPPTTPSKP